MLGARKSPTTLGHNQIIGHPSLRAKDHAIVRRMDLTMFGAYYSRVIDRDSGLSGNPKSVFAKSGGPVGETAGTA